MIRAQMPSGGAVAQERIHPRRPPRNARDVATSLGSTYGAGTVEQMAARVFQGSAAAFLGIQTPTVPVGTRSHITWF